MSQDNVIKLAQPGEFCDALTDVLRQGARTLLAQAVEAEVAIFLESHADELTEGGHRRLVRHGHLPEREIATGIGHVGVRQPRVRDRDSRGEERIRFSPSSWACRRATALCAPLEEPRGADPTEGHFHGGFRRGPRRTWRPRRRRPFGVVHRQAEGGLGRGTCALAFYDFPAEHWKHLRTTNPIESTFATVRHRTIRSKGCLSNKTALAMAFKLVDGAQNPSATLRAIQGHLKRFAQDWRRLDGQNMLPKLVANPKFKDGIEASPPQAKAAA